uniref:HAP1 N-terminal domain-containing protein n=1 Tax=Panagrolaimus sp. ES5 TaxID=591445 RepID=A0AC34GUF1_9BILA
MTECQKIKEKDLELAAKIGKSLLEQNKELRDRNDFLEECLTNSNETVTQLKHQLQQRSDLLNTVCSLGDDYYQQEEAARNDQIHKLHSQIVDKNAECTSQATEIQKLVRDIQHRKSSEKMLKEATSDLSTQLHAAITAHDHLKTEILSLQEVYTDVRERLHEAEEELGSYRLKSAPHRIGSSDSLYDSLASELGGNDSGFYSTPMISARTNDSGQSSSSEFCSPGSMLAEEIERLKKGEIILDEYEIPSKALLDSVRNNRRLREKSPSLADELMPSNTEGNTSSSLIAPPKLEAITEIQTPLSESQPAGSLLAIKDQTTVSSSTSRPSFKNSVSSDSDPEDPSNFEVEEECCRSSPSTSSEAAIISPPIQPPAPLNQKTFRDSSCSPIPALLIDWQSPTSISISSKPTSSSGASSPPATTITTKPCGIAQPSPRLPKQSTSMDSDDEITPRATATTIQQQQQSMTATASEESPSSSTTSDSAEDMIEQSMLSKAESNDSLNKYTGPKLGEPGKPGTRDLEFSVRKLKLRKQCPKCSSFLINVVEFEETKPINIQKIERDYQRFRESRGLPPSIHGFFTNLTMDQQQSSPPKSQKLCGPLSSQLEYLSSNPDETKTSPSRPFIFTRNFPSAPKTLALGGSAKGVVWRKPSGLTAAIPAISPSTDGILQRAEVQSPEQANSKSAESTPKRFSQPNRSSLLSALGLNTLIDSDPESPSKNASIFRSPFLFGLYQADRELSPPFGGTPIAAIGDSLELLRPSSPQGNLPSSSTAI